MIGHFENGARIATMSCRTRLKKTFFSIGDTKKTQKTRFFRGPPRDEIKTSFRHVFDLFLSDFEAKMGSKWGLGGHSEPREARRGDARRNEAKRGDVRAREARRGEARRGPGRSGPAGAVNPGDPKGFAPQVRGSPPL